jgi:hypothetical protein
MAATGDATQAKDKAGEEAMTQEREAMERLARAIEEEDSIATWWLRDVVEQIKAPMDARHARALQPITVEGLVEMGATVGEKMSHQTKYLLKGIRIFVSVHGDMEWYYAEPYQSHLLQVCPAPENMLHVDELIERVGT